MTPTYPTRGGGSQHAGLSRWQLAAFSILCLLVLYGIGASAQDAVLHLPSLAQLPNLPPNATLAFTAVVVFWSAWMVVRQRQQAVQQARQLRDYKADIVRAVSAVAAGAYDEAVIGTQDEVQHALVQLRTELRLVAEAKALRQWHSEGLAQMADLMRQTTVPEELAKRLVGSLVRYLNANQGAIFLVGADGQPAPAAAFIGADLDQITADLQAGTGLVGEAARRLHTMHVTDVPRGYLRIGSGLGSAEPAALLIVPMVFEGQLRGVIELAAFQPFTQPQTELVHQVAERAAATLFHLATHQATERMLAEAQELAEALQQREFTILESQTQIQRMNEHLEERVAERTVELEQALRELQTAQHRIVQNEKLASLGQLVAGVAHEINTPIGAIKASVVNMADFLPKALANLPRQLDTLQAAERILFLRMVDAAVQSQELATTREERQLRKDMAERMAATGVDDAKSLAAELVACGIYQDEAQYAPLLRHPAAADLLQTVGFLAQLKRNMDVIHTAADKTRKTVYALKRFAHFQIEEKLETIDLRESLEMVLTLYQNQIKYAVEVVRDMDDLPPVLGYSDELGQVWTNLIHNSLQAMDYQGTITLGLRREGELAVVSVADSGKGIPADVLPRIFEPFFTTKPQGEGSGLGLDIVRKIVEKHKGHISVTSEPGRTCFEVRLPFQPPEEDAA